MFDNGGTFDMFITTALLLLALPMTFCGYRCSGYTSVISCFLLVFVWLLLLAALIFNTIDTAGFIILTCMSLSASIVPCAVPSTQGFFTVGLATLVAAASLSPSGSPGLVFCVVTLAIGTIGAWCKSSRVAVILASTLSGASVIAACCASYMVANANQKYDRYSSYHQDYRSDYDRNYEFGDVRSKIPSPNVVLVVFACAFFIGLATQNCFDASNEANSTDNTAPLEIEEVQMRPTTPATRPNDAPFHAV
ncbi:hypothetical protein ACHHYP_02386 [Achlya hypogyna]|uniref:Uncharacterized protein n=1 Tax=Achlya hypogyna TaxID=1202772 RepID=A0A1V9Z6L4_ACHHY|nr:hypothetical protein ACHHYP_02386 [Achlya hypogyna]